MKVKNLNNFTNIGNANIQLVIYMINFLKLMLSLLKIVNNSLIILLFLQMISKYERSFQLKSQPYEGSVAPRILQCTEESVC